MKRLLITLLTISYLASCQQDTNSINTKKKIIFPQIEKAGEQEEVESILLTHSSLELNLEGYTSIQLDISGDISFESFETSSRIKPQVVGTLAIVPCTFYDYRDIELPMIKINSSNIDKYFDFYYNESRLKIADFNILKFEKINTDTFKMKLKNKYLKKIKKGSWTSNECGKVRARNYNNTNFSQADPLHYINLDLILIKKF